MKKRILTMLLMFVMSITLVTIAFAKPISDKLNTFEDHIMKEISAMSNYSDVRLVEKPNVIRQNMDQSTDIYDVEEVQPFWVFCCDPSTMNVVNYGTSFTVHMIGPGNHCTATIYIEQRCTYCNAFHGSSVIGEYTHLH